MTWQDIKDMLWPALELAGLDPVSDALTEAGLYVTCSRGEEWWTLGLVEVVQADMVGIILERGRHGPRVEYTCSISTEALGHCLTSAVAELEEGDI